MPRFAPFTVAFVVLSATACAHLVQKQTYTTDPVVVQQAQRDYFANELVQGLPEETFLRWYTRDGTWKDDARPSIQAVRQQPLLTVYDVGAGRSVAGSVVFKDKALDHWDNWRLVQESVVSTWRKESVVPPRVDEDTLRRMSALNPQTDKASHRPAGDRPAACGLEAGEAIETLVPIVFDKAHGNRIDRFASSSRSASNPEQFGLLPAGTRLEIRRWNPIEGRQVRDAKGVGYLLDAPLGLSSYEGVFCPAGHCVPLGSEAMLSSDLEVYGPGGGGEALAILPSVSRAPLWLAPAGRLPSGSAVVVHRWGACTTGEAEIEPVGASGVGVAVRLTIPFAPLDLFRPAGKSAATIKAGG